MEKNIQKLLLVLFYLLFFAGCAQKIPVTWKERIINHKSDTLALSYSEYGDRSNKTILFLHGFGENRHTWRFLVPRLSQDYHLVMLDLKGFGDSPKNDDIYYSVYDQAAIVNNFIEEHKLKNITLVGRSFGGGVALIMALLQKDKLVEKNIEKLVLINTMSYKQNLPSMMETLNKPIIGYLGIHLLSNRWIANEGYKYAFYNDKLISKESVDYTANYLSFPLAKYAYLQTVKQLIPDDLDVIEKRYKEIRLPTLIIWGKEDVSILVNKAYRLKKALRNSYLKVLPQVGHMPQEEKPNIVSDEILKFMDSY